LKIPHQTFSGDIEVKRIKRSKLLQEEMRPGNQAMRILQWTAILKFHLEKKISGNQAEMKKCLDFIPEDKEVDDKSLKPNLKEKSKDWRSLKPKYRKGAKV